MRISDFGVSATAAKLIAECGLWIRLRTLQGDNRCGYCVPVLAHLRERTKRSGLPQTSGR